MYPDLLLESLILWRDFNSTQYLNLNPYLAVHAVSWYWYRSLPQLTKDKKFKSTRLQMFQIIHSDPDEIITSDMNEIVTVVSCFMSEWLPLIKRKIVQSKNQTVNIEVFVFWQQRIVLVCMRNLHPLFSTLNHRLI